MRPERKCGERQAEQLASVAEFTLALLRHPWPDQFASAYTDWRRWKDSHELLYALAKRCTNCGMAGPALSAWLDIAPDSVLMPGCLRGAHDPEP